MQMPEQPPLRRAGTLGDRVFAWLTRGAAALTLLLLVGIIVSLVIGAWPSIRHFGLPFLWTSEWDPVQEKFGGLVMIYGTLATSLIALIIAVPSGRLSHFGDSSVRNTAMPKLIGTAMTRAISEVASVP